MGAYLDLKRNVSDFPQLSLVRPVVKLRTSRIQTLLKFALIVSCAKPIKSYR